MTRFISFATFVIVRLQRWCHQIHLVYQGHAETVHYSNICCICTSLCNLKQRLIEYQTIRIFILTSIYVRLGQILPNLNLLGGAWIEFINIKIEISFAIGQKEFYKHPTMLSFKMFGSSVAMIDNQHWAVSCSKMYRMIQRLQCQPDISLRGPNVD